MELLERLYAKLIFVNGGRMLSTHVVILRTSSLNTVCNNGYMRRQRLAVMRDRRTCVVTAGRNDWTRVYAVYDP